MDPLNKINKSTDSTYLLAVESIKIGFNAMYCNPNNVSIDSKDLVVEASQLRLKNNELEIKKILKKKLLYLNLTWFSLDKIPRLI